MTASFAVAEDDYKLPDPPPLMPHVASSSRSNPDQRLVKQRELRRKILLQQWDYNWAVDEKKPITRLQVSISQQRLQIFQDDKMVGDGPVSTAGTGYVTPVGKFTVIGKEKDHKSSQYGELVDKNGNIVNWDANAGDPVPVGLTYQASPMPFFLRLTDGGVGLHSGFLPGYAASHGCIRLPHTLAEKLFDGVALNTPVEVVP